MTMTLAEWEQVAGQVIESLATAHAVDEIERQIGESRATAAYRRTLGENGKLIDNVYRTMRNRIAEDIRAKAVTAAH